MITSLGVAIPKSDASREWLSERVNENFVRTTGISHTWRFPGPASELAAHAVRAANVENVDRIEAVVCVTQSPDRSCPNMAYDVAREFGLRKDIPLIDVNQACAGFVYGLWLSTKLRLNVLLVVVDKLRMELGEAATNHFIFSDAAAAAVVDAHDTSWATPAYFHNEPEGVEKIVVSRAGFMRLKGADTFDFVCREVPRFINRCVTEDDNVLVQHAANLSMMNIVELRSGYSQRSISAIGETGNMSMVSIPAAIALKEQEALGKWLLLVGYGAGFSAALMQVLWPSGPVSRVVRV